MKGHKIPVVLAGVILSVFLLAGYGYRNLQGARITEEKMQAYVVVLEAIRGANPALLSKLGTLSHQPVEGHVQEAIEKIALKAGFSQYDEFKAVNGKVITILHALSQPDEHEKRSQLDGIQKEDEQRLDAMLNDPAIPEQAKMELRNAKERVVRANNESMEYVADAERNRQSFTTEDKESVAVVEKYKERIWQILPHPRTGAR